jgi:hypothetical protein
MNTKHELLAQIHFRHAYFLNNIPNCFSVTPSAETERVLLNHALIFKKSNDGFRLAFEAVNNAQTKTRKEVIASEEILRFVVTLKDELFYNYTQTGTTDILNSCFHFHNFNSNSDERLHTSEYASAADCVDEQLFKNESVTKPFAYIELKLSNLVKEVYYIHFREKETYWRYLLVSDYLQTLVNPAILNGSITFTGPVPVLLPNDSKALVFESTKPIGIKQKQESVFQLVESYNSELKKGRIVIKMLPYPDVKNISKIFFGENKEYSEIIL